MISKEEVLLVRDRVADFAIVFTDAILEGDETDVLSVMEDFSSFFCNALSVARSEGRLSVLTTINN
jgi:hypothetical protein